MADTKKNKRTIEISISEDVYNKLDSQLKFFKNMQLPELSELENVAELISFYLEQLTTPAKDMQEMKEKLEKNLRSLSEGEITMDTFLEAFEPDKKKKKENKDENTGWDIDEDEGESEE